MKKLIVLIFVLILINGCSNYEKSNTNKYLDANLNEYGDIIINEKDITNVATFYNYNVDGVNVQLIAVKAQDGTVRTAFNTCQACSPSPNAYFTQDGDYFVCENCKNRFHINEMGVEHGGCNPIPITDKNKKVENGIITISKNYIKEYKDKFVNWSGKK